MSLESHAQRITQRNVRKENRYRGRPSETVQSARHSADLIRRQQVHQKALRRDR